MSDAVDTRRMSRDQKEALAAELLRRRAERGAANHLSAGQQALWFLHQLAPESPSFNLMSITEIEGACDVARLRGALHTVVERHPMLRSTYEVVDGIPRGRISPAQSVDLPLIDASAWSAEALEDWQAVEADRPFDLERGPVVRATLLRRGPDRYLLFIGLHHIAVDFWSLQVLLDELQAAYAGTALPALTATYADFVRWQEEMLAGPEGAEHWEYWQSQLGGDLPTLDLPADRAPLPQPSYAGATYHFTIDAPLTEGLRAVSQTRGVTLYTTVLAAFMVLLHRYTGQDDVIVGSTMLGRPAAYERVVGYFVNVVPVRATLQGNPSFSAFVQGLRKTVVGAIAHHDYPFPTLVERLRPERDTDRNPVFQAVFNWNQERQVHAQTATASNGTERHGNESLSLRSLTVEQRGASLEPGLMMSDGERSLEGYVRYSTDLYDAETIARLAGHFQTLLAGIVANPDCPIGQLPLLTDAERHQLLVTWNQTDHAWPDAPTTLHGLIEAQVARTPHATAVVFEGAHRSYDQLNRRANRLAHHLRSLGVGPDVLVAVAAERSLDLHVGLLGTLKAGGAYVPLDPAYPPERLAFMLADVHPPVLLTQSHLRQHLPPFAGPVLCLDQLDALLAAQPDTNPDPVNAPDDLAYVIYTSGSTGQPKGVMVSHANVRNTILATGESWDVGPNDHVLQKAAFSFDVAAWEFFLALLVGGRVVVASPGGHVDTRYLADLIAREGVTITSFIPTMMRYFLEEPTSARCTSLRLISCGGEPMPPEIPRQALNRFDIQFFNGYGPTETTIRSSEWRCRKDWPEATIPIGYPLANQTFHVIDRYGQLAPIGVPGELFIGGASVARGYLHRPDLTAERFLPDPFSPQPGGRVYRTGDLVRRRADGALEFLGRLDDQVKLRGYRIELGEIEAVLARYPGVRSALALIREDRPGDRRLVAYVVPGERNTSDTDQLRQYVGRHLPDYMAPSAVIALRTIPLLPNGKVDRQSLPAPAASTQRLSVAPRTPTEATLARIWANVLGLEQVGVDDNFFELGGHSLLATQVTSRARTTFGAEVPLRLVFQEPTVAGLAVEIDRLRNRVGAALLPGTDQPIPLAARDGELPLSYSQQQLWVLEQFEPEGRAYTVPIAVRLRGILDTSLLERSLNAVVARHESLRTTFPGAGGEPRQRIAPEATLTLPLVDLRELPAAERELQAYRRMLDVVAEPFDLEHGPLLRALLLRLADDEHVVLLAVHHIVADGWSIGVLLREVSSCYEDLTAGTDPVLPPLPLQFADYAAWQRGRLASGLLEEHLAYWRERLEGMPGSLDLPADRPRPPVRSGRGARLNVTLPGSTFGRLSDLCHAEGATPFIGLTAILQLLLARYTGQDDIVVGTPIANRPRRELESLIGFFVNTLVLRADLSGNPGFRELLRRVREVTLGAYDHQDLPFEVLVDALQPSRTLSYTPLFQVMITLQNTPLPEMRLSDLTLEPFDLDWGAAKFDLGLTFTERAGDLHLSINYSTDLYDAETIARLAGHFQTLLAGIVANPDCPIGQLPLLTDAERHQLLVTWNQTDHAWPDAPTTLHGLIEAQVARTPHATAVVFEGAHRSYDQLNRRANRLAHHLRSLGVGPDVLVAVAAERSLDLHVGLLGTLKAGGAYVPLDPAYPPERLAFMLADVHPPVLLTQSHLRQHLPPFAGPVLCLDQLDALLAAQPDTNPDPVNAPDDLAYVIYTSGSTGQPKGVMVSHANVRNTILAIVESYVITPADRVLTSTTVSFDVAVWELFGILAAGATLVLARPGGEADPRYLIETIRQEKITVMRFPPALLPHLFARATTQDLPTVRILSSGGEAVSPEIPQEVLARFNAQFWNAYGPTETTVRSSHWRCPPGWSGSTVPIGRPIANTAFYVLDRNSQPVPIGIPGELFIGGRGVARGYLNRPDVTAERFLPDPFSSVPGARVYRTGDLVRYRADGNLEFLGRVDDQVKLRGYRIELGEIEAVLARHPQVRECQVVMREDRPGDRRLVAYVIASDDASPSVDDLRRFAGRHLPDYMVPSAVVFLSAFPLTPNRKVDRAALPAPVPHRSTQDPSARPRTGTEAALARIWSEILRLDQVGVDDNFFELGGDSILAIQIVSRATQAGLPLQPRQLFQAQTVAELAALVGSGPATVAGQGAVTGEVPLTSIQRWFFERDLPNPHHFNQALLLEVARPLDPEILRGAVAYLHAHHDALRLRFVRDDAGWRQVDLPTVDTEVVDDHDLGALADGEQTRAIAALAEAAQQSLHLSDGPLFRVVSFNLGRERPGRLLVVAHHLIVDGVSWRVLLEDLWLAYQQLERGVPVQFPAKTTSYQAWANALLDFAGSPEARADASYWLRPSDCPAPLPEDGPGGPDDEASQRDVTVWLDADETRALLQDVPTFYRTDITAALLTAVAISLATWTGDPDVFLDLETHGREEVDTKFDLSRTVGWFTALVPLRFQVPDGDPVGALRAIHDQLRAVPQHGLSYGVLRYLGDDATRAALSAQAQPQVAVNYLGQLDPPAASPFRPSDEPVGPSRDLATPRAHLLQVTAAVIDRRLRLSWTYSTSHHHPETIVRLADDSLATLRALVSPPKSAPAIDVTPADFPLAGLGQDDLARLLARLPRLEEDA